jgi:hypothetical protein
MDVIIIGIVLAILIAVTGYELATGYAGVRLGFTRQQVSRDDQPLVYWGVVGIKIVAVLFIAWQVWG